MSQADIVSIMSDAVYTALLAAAPMLLSGLLVGLIISIFQATTQINDATLTFVPKLVAILVVLLVCFGWIMTTMSDFTERIFAIMAAIGRS